MKIGIFVGSFNPVHKGHIYILEKLISKKYLDKVFVIPTMPYWHKLDLIDIKHRINMLKFFETDKIIIDDENNYLKYTYEIMDKYHEKYKDADIKLIIGADNLKDLNKWMNIDKILEYGVVVVGRNDIDITKYNYKNIVYADIKQYNISSTEIRNNKNKKSEHLDDRVAKYIEENNLYMN